MTDRHDNPRCERCDSRSAVLFELTVFGPLDLRETRLCAECGAADTTTEVPGEGQEESFAYMGPIDFEVLRASIRRAEADDATDSAALQFVASELPRIAAAHAQTLPDDVQAFVVRHSR